MSLFIQRQNKQETYTWLLVAKKWHIPKGVALMVANLLLDQLFKLNPDQGIYAEEYQKDLLININVKNRNLNRILIPAFHHRQNWFYNTLTAILWYFLQKDAEKDVIVVVGDDNMKICDAVFTEMLRNSGKYRMAKYQKMNPAIIIYWQFQRRLYFIPNYDNYMQSNNSEDNIIIFLDSNNTCIEMFKILMTLDKPHRLIVHANTKELYETYSLPAHNERIILPDLFTTVIGEDVIDKLKPSYSSSQYSNLYFCVD